MSPINSPTKTDPGYAIASGRIVLLLSSYFSGTSLYTCSIERASFELRVFETADSVLGGPKPYRREH